MMFMGVSAVEYSDYQSRGIYQACVMHFSPVNTKKSNTEKAEHENDVMLSLIPLLLLNVSLPHPHLSFFAGMRTHIRCEVAIDHIVLL